MGRDGSYVGVDPLEWVGAVTLQSLAAHQTFMAHMNAMDVPFHLLYGGLSNTNGAAAVGVRAQSFAVAIPQRNRYPLPCLSLFRSPKFWWTSFIYGPLRCLLFPCSVLGRGWEGGRGGGGNPGLGDLDLNRMMHNRNTRAVGFIFPLRRPFKNDVR